MVDRFAPRPLDPRGGGGAGGFGCPLLCALPCGRPPPPPPPTASPPPPISLSSASRRATARAKSNSPTLAFSSTPSLAASPSLALRAPRPLAPTSWSRGHETRPHHPAPDPHASR